MFNELLPYLKVFAAAFCLVTCIGCGVMAATADNDTPSP